MRKSDERSAQDKKSYAIIDICNRLLYTIIKYILFGRKPNGVVYDKLQDDRAGSF